MDWELFHFNEESDCEDAAGSKGVEFWVNSLRNGPLMESIL